MPYKSDAQRKFFHTDTAKEAGITGKEVNEFDQASKGKELPEHVKKMDEGGVAEPDDKKFATDLGQGMKDGVNHDTDAVKSYLSSKFAQLLKPGMGEDKPQTTQPQENPTTAPQQGMADGGYPHVTFMEDETPAEVKETTHLKEEPKMAKGGIVQGADGSDRDKEPVKPKNVDPAQANKLASIYKAMGIKGYDGGGVAATPATPPVPQPGDPGYTSFIQDLLSKVGDAGSAAGGALQRALGLSAPTMPTVSPNATNPNLTGAIQEGITGGANAAVAPLNPTATPTGAALPSPDTMNTLGLGRLPGAVTAPGGATGSFDAPQGTASAVAKPTPPSAPAGGGAPAPDLKNLFNQDTSKLTAGVNPEDRQAIVNSLQERQHGIGSLIGQALAGFGDSLAAKGGKEQHSLAGIFSMQKDQRAEALGNFDKARQDRLQKLQLQTQMGQNALDGLAAQDAYGTDEHLNSMLGAPKGTAHKDLPLYFQMKAAGVAQQEKDTDLYMKAHAQAATDVDNAVKNSSMLNIKPSPAQLQASGSKLADNYYNRAKGNILVKPSDGGPSQWIPAQNIGKAKQMDPNLQVQP